MAANAKIKTNSTESSPSDLVITRVFDAPRELVWKAWTDPAHVQQWWGPKGFTNPRCEWNVRPNGAIHIDMRAPDGVVYPMSGVFHEIVEPERLVFVASALDEDGNSMFDVLTTATFTDQRGKTSLTLQLRVITTTPRAPQYLKGQEIGWTQSLDRLADHLARNTAQDVADSNPEFAITRAFNAPREQVFKALTEARALAQWWGPKGCSIEVRKLDLRSGGVFHYSMRMGSQPQMWGKFVYREIKPPERIVFVNSFSDENCGLAQNPWMPNWPLEILNTLTLTEHEGKTTLSLRGGPINATDEQRKAFAANRKNLQQGFAGTFDQLDAYLVRA